MTFLLFPLSGELLLACMQVPCASQLIREIPRRRHLVRSADDQLCRVDSQISQLMHNAYQNFGMSSVVNLSNPSIGAKFLTLNWRKFDHLASQVGGARNIFFNLFGHSRAENTFWLDSSSTEKVCLLPDDLYYYFLTKLLVQLNQVSITSYLPRCALRIHFSHIKWQDSENVTEWLRPWTPNITKVNNGWEVLW